MEGSQRRTDDQTIQPSVNKQPIVPALKCKKFFLRNHRKSIFATFALLSLGQKNKSTFILMTRMNSIEFFYRAHRKLELHSNFGCQQLILYV